MKQGKLNHPQPSKMSLQIANPVPEQTLSTQPEGKKSKNQKKGKVLVPKEECMICANNIKSGTKQKCLFCDFECCKSCWVTHMDTSKTTECMSCHTHYNFEHLSLLPLILKKKGVSILLEQLFKKEEEKFAATFQLIEKIKEKDETFNILTNNEKEINILRDEYQDFWGKASSLKTKIWKIICNPKAKEEDIDYLPQIKKNYDSIIVISDEIDKQIHQKLSLSTTLRNNIDILNTEIKTDNCEQVKWLPKCPHVNCKGYLMSKPKSTSTTEISFDSFSQCNLCNTSVCNKCDAIIKNNFNLDEEKKQTDTNLLSQHVCSEDELKTKNMIAKDSRPCPKCKAPIFKIKGCNHMWCVLCKVGFDYISLKIIPNSSNTNPHFADYQAELKKKGLTLNSREAGDFICGGLNHNFNGYTLKDLGRALKATLPPEEQNELKMKNDLYYRSGIPIMKIRDSLSIYIRILSFAALWCGILENELRAIRTKMKDMRDLNRVDRIDYCSGKINKDKFLSKIKTNVLKMGEQEIIWNLKELLYEVLISELNFIDGKYSQYPLPPRNRINKYVEAYIDIDKSCSHILHVFDFYNSMINKYVSTTSNRKGVNLSNVIWAMEEPEMVTFSTDEIQQMIFKSPDFKPLPSSLNRGDTLMPYILSAKSLNSKIVSLRDGRTVPGLVKHHGFSIIPKSSKR